MTQKHGVDVFPHVAGWDAQPWCEQCNLPEDICRCHDDAIPGDVAAGGAWACTLRVTNMIGVESVYRLDRWD